MFSVEQACVGRDEIRAPLKKARVFGDSPGLGDVFIYILFC